MGARINPKGPKGDQYEDPHPGSEKNLGEVDFNMKWGPNLGEKEQFLKSGGEI